MRKILYNYAHNCCIKSQPYNTKTGYEVGKFDVVYQFNFNDIDKNFYQKNKHILDQKIGAGYWIWKYYFALKLINDPSINEGDLIFYCDSGSHFISDIQPLVDVFLRDDLSIMTFSQLHKSSLCTKRDMFVLMNADYPKFTQTCQRVGGFFMFRKNEISKKFFTQCLDYSQDYRIITDSPNEMGLENYKDFFVHRHDESLISIMAKKYDLYPYRNPCQDGITWNLEICNNCFTDECFENYIKNGGNKFFKTFKQYPFIESDTKSNYPTIIELTRNRT